MAHGGESSGLRNANKSLDGWFADGKHISMSNATVPTNYVRGYEASAAFRGARYEISATEAIPFALVRVVRVNRALRMHMEARP